MNPAPAADVPKLSCHFKNLLNLPEFILWNCLPAPDNNFVTFTVSFAVNENLSISYGISDVDYELSTKSSEESSGFSASYTMGGMTLGAVANKSDSLLGTAGTDRTFTEVSLAFAF